VGFSTSHNSIGLHGLQQGQQKQSKNVMNASLGEEMQLHAFLTSPLYAGNSKASRSSNFTLGTYRTAVNNRQKTEWSRQPEFKKID
jgi:hypothetical protein